MAQLQPTQSQGPQRALLVALELSARKNRGWTADESLDELAELAATAGGLVLDRVVQRRIDPDPATLIGEGKAREVEVRRAELGCDLVIFDDELSPPQQRNLERVINCGIIDRTALILEIFAQRARTREARLQVELAQLNYRLPRLAGRGVDLSRLGGGIGTRGPGETKLEVDRRQIRERISHLRRELGDIEAHRQRLRTARGARDVPVVALTGYTNAGKSTLHRLLAGSDVLAEDRLFATLDATARRVEPVGGEPYILTDTVGFVHKLPHQLVAAFRSTLEEVLSADLLLHVVDAAHPKREEHVRTVEEVLRELGAVDRPTLLVLNKADRLADAAEAALLARVHGGVAVSAVAGTGLDELCAAIQEGLASRRRTVEVLVPYARSGWVAWIHEHGKVLEEQYREGGTLVRAELPASQAARVLAALAAGGETG